MVFSIECAVPRCPLRRAFFDSAWSFCHSDCIPEQLALRALADHLWSKPNGRSRGRLPLGITRHPDQPWTYHCCLVSHDTGYIDCGLILLPKNGKDVR